MGLKIRWGGRVGVRACRRFLRPLFWLTGRLGFRFAAFGGREERGVLTTVDVGVGRTVRNWTVNGGISLLFWSVVVGWVGYSNIFVRVESLQLFFREYPKSLSQNSNQPEQSKVKCHTATKRP